MKSKSLDCSWMSKRHDFYSALDNLVEYYSACREAQDLRCMVMLEGETDALFINLCCN